MTPAPAIQTPSIHGTALSVGGAGVLLRGKSGAGKSDLALRLLDSPGYGVGAVLLKAFLIGDDQLYLWTEDGAVYATAPPALAGLLEVRGTGLLTVPFERRARLHLVVDLEHGPLPERLPDGPATVVIAGVTLPRLVLNPRLASAPAQIRAALCTLAHP